MVDERSIAGVGDGFDLVEYPCEYMFKAVGRTTPDFEIGIRQKVADQVGEANLVRETSMESRNGKYVSMTFVVKLENRRQLETVYAALATHPGVVMTL
jgi:putative lipoic acid-binding regulatory protein